VDLAPALLFGPIVLPTPSAQVTRAFTPPSAVHLRAVSVSSAARHARLLTAVSSQHPQVQARRYKLISFVSGTHRGRRATGLEEA
jgi:hypothetical protein